MNTVVLNNPPRTESFNPVDRPRAKLAASTSNLLLGAYPRSFLMVGREPVCGLPSLKALNLLDAIIALSWEELEHATELHECGGTHGATLRAQIGEHKRSSNDRLDRAFDDLLTFQWCFPVALLSGSHTVNSVLADWRKCQRTYIWRFTAEFITLCQNVQLFIKYPNHHARKFKTPLAHRLHELLLVFAGRKFTYWNVTTGEILRLLGAEQYAYTPDHFFDRKILPLIAEIETVTGWEIDFEKFPGSKIAPTQRVRFAIGKNRSERTRIDNSVARCDWKGELSTREGADPDQADRLDESDDAKSILDEPDSPPASGAEVF